MKHLSLFLLLMITLSLPLSSCSFSASTRPVFLPAVSATTDAPTPEAVAVLPGSVTRVSSVNTQATPMNTSTPGKQPAAAKAATITQAATSIITDPATATPDAPILYYTQAGDTLKALAARFDVDEKEITSPSPLPPDGLLDPKILLMIPHRLKETSSDKQVMPDSEIVYSPSALDLDLSGFIKSAGGYLSTYREWRSYGWLDGAQVMNTVGLENSINPRLLLLILEQQSRWVYGQPATIAEKDFPIGFLKMENERNGLYFQLSWAVQQLNIGYYGWRQGRITELTFPDGQKLRLAPSLNAGTVAVLYLFSRLYNEPQWAGILYGPDGMMPTYEKMFGNPWLRAQSVEPLFPATLTQPPLEFPFMAGKNWSFTGGPHSAWGPDGARAAIDFAPASTVHGCYQSDDWVTAAAAGLVVRSENAVVMVDLDGDGHEQTGWDIMYLHIATEDRIKVGTWLNLGDKIGHPSCEGGMATGTHTHVARKYNGEWILADGPLPFNFDGWITHAGAEQYQGWMTKGGQKITSSLVGEYFSVISHPQQ